MSAATYKCVNCKDPFTARTADRKRGWARFCSKSCKAKKQEQRTGQFKDLIHNNDRALYDSTGGWDEHKDWLSK